jgi:hypothetical protein
MRIGLEISYGKVMFLGRLLKTFVLAKAKYINRLGEGGL